jgi:hypothetical protein
MGQYLSGRIYISIYYHHENYHRGCYAFGVSGYRLTIFYGFQREWRNGLNG